MRRYLVVAACAMLAVLVGASTASAFIANPQAPGNWGTLTTCNTNGQVVVPGNEAFNTGDYLRIGWRTMTEAQSNNFLTAVTGQLTIFSGTTPVATWNMAPGASTGPNSLWTAPYSPPHRVITVNGGRPLWQTFAFFQVNLAQGTYTVDASFQVSKTVNNGATVFKAGTTWFSNAGCTLTVV